jgi:hypothetical protein
VWKTRSDCLHKRLELDVCQQSLYRESLHVKGFEHVEVGSLMMHDTYVGRGGAVVMHSPCHGRFRVLYSVGVPVRNLALQRNEDRVQ